MSGLEWTHHKGHEIHDAETDRVFVEVWEASGRDNGSHIAQLTLKGIGSLEEAKAIVEALVAAVPTRQVRLL